MGAPHRAARVGERRGVAVPLSMLRILREAVVGCPERSVQRPAYVPLCIPHFKARFLGESPQSYSPSCLICAVLISAPLHNKGTGSMSSPLVAVTVGDPAGIGPERPGTGVLGRLIKRFQV